MAKYISGIDKNTGIRYITFGTGAKTMVIVPGLSIGYVTDSAEAVADAFAAFANDYTIYLFDIREDVPEDYSLSRMGEDLVSAINSLGLKDIHLYGCSMGGMQSMYIAGTYPELIKKLVVVSSSAKETATSKEAIGNWLLLARKKKCLELTMDMGARIYSPAVFEASRDAFALMAESLTDDALSRFINTAHAIEGLDITEKLGAIKCPVLAIGSEGDKVLGGEASAEIARLSGGELYMYGEDTSHAIYDEVLEVRAKAKEFFDR